MEMPETILAQPVNSRWRPLPHPSKDQHNRTSKLQTQPATRRARTVDTDTARARHEQQQETAGNADVLPEMNDHVVLKRGIGFAQRRHLTQEAIDYAAKKTKERNIDMLVDAQPNPCGSMMIKKRRAINLKPAKDFKALPGSGFRQVGDTVTA